MRASWLLCLAVAGCTVSSTMGDAGARPGSGADLSPAGAMRLFRFGVFGDARPHDQNVTSDFPSAVLTNIFTQAEERSLHFMVGTGDYMFANNEMTVSAQVSLVLQAESPYHAPVYHTLGNHECKGWTASNCPLGNESPNMRAFMNNLLPKGVGKPYFRVDLDTPKGKAKLLFVAANAWSDEQAAWLTTQMADPTAYTFAVRHEPPSETSAPGVQPSEDILHAAPLTLELLGHYHTYQRVDTLHVISGNGGAPNDSNTYGYLIVEQLEDGNVAVSEIDQASNMPTDAWRVTPNGESLP